LGETPSLPRFGNGAMIDRVLSYPVHSFRDLDLNARADLESFNVRVHRLRESADAYDSSEHTGLPRSRGASSSAGSGFPLLPEYRKQV